MDLINAQGLSYFEAQQKKRADRLKEFIATPFDSNNKEQMDALKGYLDAFEFNLNQMYLYQALSTGVKTWFGSWLISRVLPLPEGMQYFLTTFLYVGAAAFILKEFNMNNFYEHTQEMKLLYNWCLKNNKTLYNANLDNTSKLAMPLIQRFIKLLAPLCDTQFIIAWPTDSELNDNSDNQWSKTLRAGYAAAQATFTQFANQMPTAEQARIHELKIQVEKRRLDVTLFKGLEQAINYFFTSKEFQVILLNNIKSPTETAVSSIRSLLFK